MNLESKARENFVFDSMKRTIYPREFFELVQKRLTSG